MLKFWKPYEPDEQTPWNLPRVWMLHRRAGFGANWQQLQRDLKEGPKESVARVVAGKTRESVTDSFEETSNFLLKQAIQSNQLSRMSAWWIMRMYLGPNPFAERRTLIWHNHFATSNRVIQNLFRMYRQNKLFRDFGMGKFGILLEKTVKDPTMLVWLNANDNRRAHPNENLGRELLELFSLGEGNYTEQDVKETARALAGWTASDMIETPADIFSESDSDKLRLRPDWQDPFHKTILGQTGDWNGEDVFRIVQQHPATSQRLAWRVCDELFGENVVSSEAIHELALGLAENELDMHWAFVTVLNSELFFSNSNLKTRIAAPETFALGILIALQTEKTPASTLALANIFTTLGRSLFDPPNVGGWDGGRLWLNARTLVARSNFVHEVINNGLNRTAAPPDWDGLLARFDEAGDVGSVVTQLGELLLGWDRNSENDRAILAVATEEAEQHSPASRWPFVAQLLLNSSSGHLC